jgi:hypothetical protein
MLVCNLMPRLHHPVFNWELFCERACDDGFFLIIEAADPLYSDEETRQLLIELGGSNITLISKS